MFQRYLIIFFIPIFASISCSPAAKVQMSYTEKNMKFNNLLELNDRSERAFMYHHYCLGGEPINKNFMLNFETISNLLLYEATDRMNIPPKMVVHRILNRRKAIQQQLSEHYNALGCESEESRMAKAHYEAFSNFDQKQIKDLINT